MLVLLLLGFASGVPLLLTFSTLATWLADIGMEKSKIGAFALVGLSYTFKFAWGPVVDNLNLPVLHKLFGRRKSWLLLTQSLILLSILAVSSVSPKDSLFLFTIFAVCISLFSSVQDVAVDAYRTEIMEGKNLADAASVFVFGYRIGMLVAGAGALFVADFYGWNAAYQAMAACMLLGIATLIFLAREPKYKPKKKQKTIADKLYHAVVVPFRDFAQNNFWWLILAFIFAFRLSDAFAGLMVQPFLLEIGFSKSEIAGIVKIFGFAATIFGSFLGAYIASKFSLKNALLFAIILQIATNVTYIFQAQIGYDPEFLVFAISMDNISGGLSAAIMIAYMMKLCNIEFTATQYALLSSFAALASKTVAGWLLKITDLKECS